VICGLAYPIAERLFREARERDLTFGETLEIALIEGWFAGPRLVREMPTVPNQEGHR
jgi:hypothetical protein